MMTDEQRCGHILMTDKRYDECLHRCRFREGHSGGHDFTALPPFLRHDWTTPPLSKANPVRAWACRVTLFVGVVVAGFAAVDRWMG